MPPGRAGGVSGGEGEAQKDTLYKASWGTGLNVSSCLPRPPLLSGELPLQLAQRETEKTPGEKTQRPQIAGTTFSEGSPSGLRPCSGLQRKLWGHQTGDIPGFLSVENRAQIQGDGSWKNPRIFYNRLGLS